MTEAPEPPAAEVVTRQMVAERLILEMAPSFQGGHCKVGGEVAEFLGIPFPLTMKNLERAARARGYGAYTLWPWLRKMRGKP